MMYVHVYPHLDGLEKAGFRTWFIHPDDVNNREQQAKKGDMIVKCKVWENARKTANIKILCTEQLFIYALDPASAELKGKTIFFM